MNGELLWRRVPMAAFLGCLDFSQTQANKSYLKLLSTLIATRLRIHDPSHKILRISCQDGLRASVFYKAVLCARKLIIIADMY